MGYHYKFLIVAHRVFETVLVTWLDQLLIIDLTLRKFLLTGPVVPKLFFDNKKVFLLVKTLLDVILNFKEFKL